MTRKALMCLIITVLSVSLVACGKKYEKEIEEVTNLEAKDRNDVSDKNFNKYERKNSDIYVYEDGSVITLTYKALKDNDNTASRLYRKNETTGKYEKDYNAKPKKYMKSHEPDYKEENLSK